MDLGWVRKDFKFRFFKSAYAVFFGASVSKADLKKATDVLLF